MSSHEVIAPETREKYEYDALGERHCLHQFVFYGGPMGTYMNSQPRVCKWCGHQQGDVDAHEHFWEEMEEGSDLLVCRSCEESKWRWELEPEARQQRGK